MKKNKHIAVWSSPRSCSTLLTRAFEQLEGCLIFDEPFYSPYLVTHGFHHPHRSEIMSLYETDYKKVIEQITGDLPEGFDFSFQKHLAKNVLPHFGRDWLKDINSFLLIRDPKKTILSYQKVLKEVSFHDVGIEELYNVFMEIKALKKQAPLVIDGDNLLKNPVKTLKSICHYIDVPYSEKMLSWLPGLHNSNLFFTGVLSSYKNTWYSTVASSSGFLLDAEKQICFPDELMPLLKNCMPYYEKLLQHCLNLN
ncbi:MAG: hypothetical protein WA933_22990 [Microcoleaceae cyanobacterium]